MLTQMMITGVSTLKLIARVTSVTQDTHNAKDFLTQTLVSRQEFSQHTLEIPQYMAPWTNSYTVSNDLNFQSRHCGEKEVTVLLAFHLVAEKKKVWVNVCVIGKIRRKPKYSKLNPHFLTCNWISGWVTTKWCPKCSNYVFKMFNWYGNVLKVLEKNFIVTLTQFKPWWYITKFYWAIRTR